MHQYCKPDDKRGVGTRLLDIAFASILQNCGRECQLGSLQVSTEIQKICISKTEIRSDHYRQIKQMYPGRQYPDGYPCDRHTLRQDGNYAAVYLDASGLASKLNTLPWLRNIGNCFGQNSLDLHQIKERVYSYVHVLIQSQEFDAGFSPPTDI